jgi:hypothetical protein
MPDDLQPVQPDKLKRDIAAVIDQHRRPHFKSQKHAAMASAIIAAAIVRHLRVENWRWFGPSIIR